MGFPSWLREAIRGLIYGTPLHRLREAARKPRHEYRTREFWDRELAGGLKSYVRGTLSAELRNATTIQLVRHCAPRATALLDIGCAGGTLGEAARAAGIDRYVGVDISEVAVAEADRSLGEFHVSDMFSFDPGANGPFDVIVFNEILYYVDVREAEREIERYSRHLKPGGVVVVSMKSDAKSQAIFEGVHRSYDWLMGVLFQEQPGQGSYSLRKSRECPPYLVGLVRPRGRDAPLSA